MDKIRKRMVACFDEITTASDSDIEAATDSLQDVINEVENIVNDIKGLLEIDSIQNIDDIKSAYGSIVELGIELY